MREPMKLMNFHIDENTNSIMNECSERLGIPKSQYIRTAIRSHGTWCLTESNAVEQNRSQSQIIDDMMTPFEPILP